MQSDKFREFYNWFYDENGEYSDNVQKYKLENFIKLDLKNPKKIIEDFDKPLLKSYFDTMIKIIKDRTEYLLS